MTKTKDYTDPACALTFPIPVRWSDMDAYQHVNNARTVTLLEEARIRFLEYEPEMVRMLSSGIVVAELEVKYRGQLRYVDSPLNITTWVSRIGASDLLLEYRVRPHSTPAHERPAIIASTRMVAYDIQKQGVRRFIPEEIEIIKRYHHEPA